MATFSSDVRGIGGKNTVINLMMNHYKHVASVKSSGYLGKPPLLKPKPANLRPQSSANPKEKTKMKDITKDEKYAETCETFKKCAKA